MKPAASAYQLKITLLGIEPPVWRRLVIPSDITFFALHRVIQRAFGWTDSHLHQFRSDKSGKLPSAQERELAFGSSAVRPGARCFYDYDFGDGWEHEVLTEAILPDERGPLPACVDGARACPPEDCGGVPGYEALSDPRDPRHGELTDWLGERFQPEEFDLAGINKRLRRLRL